MTGKQFMDLAHKKITDEKAIFTEMTQENQVAAESQTPVIESILPENTQMSLGI